MNFSYRVPDIGRFRVNVFRQRGNVAMVIRYLRAEVPHVDDLRLPVVLKELIMEKRGLILVVGATGSGKSTTLAAMIEHRNRSKTGHILTIEDPIEFVFSHEKMRRSTSAKWAWTPSRTTTRWSMPCARRRTF